MSSCSSSVLATWEIDWIIASFSGGYSFHACVPQSNIQCRPQPITKGLDKPSSFTGSTFGRLEQFVARAGFGDCFLVSNDEIELPPELESVGFAVPFLACHTINPLSMFDKGNLGGGKGAYPKLRVRHKEGLEVVEVATGGSHDNAIEH